MKNKIIILFLFLILSVIFNTAKISAVTYAGLYVDSLYQQTYNYYSASNSFSNATPPFYNKWYIDFDWTTVSGSVACQLCNRSASLECNGTCGPCLNFYDYDTQLEDEYHHKNIYWNLTKFSETFSQNYDIMVGLTSAPVCINNDGYHETNTPGISFVNGYNYIRYLPTYITNYTIIRVRMYQHEISHNYGCQDGGCPDGYYCIMNGGFDSYPYYNIPSVWCDPHCTSDFNPSLH